MTAKRIQFTPYRRVMTWAVMLCFAYLPLAVTARTSIENAVSIAAWIKSLSWAVVMTAGYLYAKHRCSSEKLAYQDGLYLASYAVTVGLMGTSFLLSIPALALVFLSSVAIALFNDIRGMENKSPDDFYKLILLIYRKRTIQ